MAILTSGSWCMAHKGCPKRTGNWLWRKARQCALTWNVSEPPQHIVLYLCQAN